MVKRRIRIARSVGSIPTRSIMKSKQIGGWGEKIAENYLRKKGYQILDRNYSSKSFRGPLRGEIDIIAQKNGIISFIEVKTLTDRRQPSLHPPAFGRHLDRASIVSPEEKVDFGKQRKLRKTAESWLMKKRIPLNSKWQIDVITIEIGKLAFAKASAGKKVKISHFENAIPYC